MRKRIGLSLSFSTLIVVAALAGCAGERPGGSMQIEVAGTAIPVLQRINERGLACWIRSGDRAFRQLALVPELDTRAGKPRILVVERGRAQGLPRFVIEASGSPVQVVTYGPLAGRSVSARINMDVTRWAAGDPACRARA